MVLQGLVSTVQVESPAHAVGHHLALVRQLRAPEIHPRVDPAQKSHIRRRSRPRGAGIHHGIVPARDVISKDRRLTMKKIWNFIADIRLTFWLLLSMAVTMGIGSYHALYNFSLFMTLDPAQIHKWLVTDGI